MYTTAIKILKTKSKMYLGNEGALKYKCTMFKNLFNTFRVER